MHCLALPSLSLSSQVYASELPIKTTHVIKVDADTASSGGCGDDTQTPNPLSRGGGVAEVKMGIRDVCPCLSL